MIVMGLGFRKDAHLESFEDVLDQCRETPPARIAILARKADHPELNRFLARHQISERLIEEADLDGIQTSTISKRVMENFGTGSVAEALALASLKPDGQLIKARIVSEDRLVTAALAGLGGESR